MRAHDGAIDEVERPVQAAVRIGLGLEVREDAVPDARCTPAIKTTRHRAACAIAFRQVAPGCAGTQDPEDAIDDRTMIEIGAARARFFGRQQRRKPRPLFVG